MNLENGMIYDLDDNGCDWRWCHVCQCETGGDCNMCPSCIGDMKADESEVE